ncbi:GNAT family N-acetyltransferase [Polynucleobacter sp. AP-Kaivos-20-H2]|uniref:GNAT family N-acetyltransferase n=1 Tax=Polynucleobacter sp. AP-Kaivos-20-H2 TaxID=2689104 RepID=UPI001C20E857|nr:GNAT family N-acetyltransferase [Polynucleobacter sp. AP-Kaivos-20-H2]MBU3605116.1 GNAT family N-acetyltransferase [Polynucleobacter sp. AP-Kaivos-20-H2]
MEILTKPWREAEVDAFLVRQEVFIREQKVPAEWELDEFDLSAVHALAYQAAHCIGTGRLVDLGGGLFQIGRMAVLAQFRHQGVGRQILEELVHLAQSQGAKSIVLHSQVAAIPFYQKLGFQSQGPIYDEAGIAHRNMILLLSK